MHQEREKGGKKKKKQEQKDTHVLTSNKFFSWEPEITDHMPDAHSKVSQPLSTKILAAFSSLLGKSTQYQA